MGHALSIRIIPENCRGCRRCQVACSSYDPGPLNPRLAGIQIVRLEDESGDYPVINMECLERFCGKTDPRNTAEAEAGVRGRLSLRGTGNGKEGQQ